MSEIIEKLIKDSTFYFMGEKHLDPDVFTEVLIDEMMLAINNTKTHHVHTSYDKSIVEETITQTKNAIRRHFGDV